MPNGTSIGRDKKDLFETGILRGMRYMNITKKCMERRAMPILQPCSKPWTTTLYNGRNCLRKQEPSMWCLPQSITTAMHCGQAREASRDFGRPWNSMDIGPGRDLVGEFTEAVRGKGLRVGLYYSMIEWDSPLCMRGKNGLLCEGASVSAV